MGHSSWPSFQTTLLPQRVPACIYRGGCWAASPPSDETEGINVGESARPLYHPFLCSWLGKHSVTSGKVGS